MVFLHDKFQRSQVDSPGIRLEFFFTARGTEMQRTPLGMLRSLLNQIFYRDPTVRPPVRETFDRRCKQFGYGKRHWEWPQVMLEELLANAILESANQQHVAVFVDALDEAGAKSAQQLATYLQRLVDRAEQKKLCLQVCISCRHYPIMESGHTIEINVEDHNQDDIATYIQDILINAEARDNTSQKMRGMLVKQLTQQANGVFQWVHIILPLIEQKVRERESFNDICCWLREVPAGLEDVYIYILCNVIDARNHEQSFLFFQWVCLAERPLTVTEMRYALVAQNVQIRMSPNRLERIRMSPTRWERIHGFVGSNEDMTRRIKVLSGGLAEVVPSRGNNESVQVVHQSVNDFLRTKGLKVLYQNIGMSKSSMNDDKILSQSQATLYRACLVYLATIHILDETTRIKGTEEEIMRNRPLLHYATENLFIHAEKAADSRSHVLQNEGEILQQVLSHWVQIYQKLYGHTRLCPPRGTTLLQMAAAANLVDLIKTTVPNSEDVAKRNRDGDTAFHLAARWGHVTAGEILRGKRADQETKNRGGNTPLSEAASGGHIEFVEWLLHEGVNMGTRGDRRALQGASLGGYQSVVEILIGAGADVNAQGGQYGNALQGAAYSGSTEIVQILLDAHAEVNAQGGQFGNALQAAACSGGTETVQILLDAHAEVNAQGGIFGSHILAAINKGQVDVVQLLLYDGVDALLTDELGQTPLHITASRNMRQILFRFPQVASAINNRNGFSQTPLHLAVYLGHIDFAIALLNFNLGADPSLPDGYGRHVMDWAHDHETLMREIHNHCPQLVLTPSDTQEVTVHRSIFELSESLSLSKPKSSWPILEQIGRYLLFLGQLDNAHYLFQLRLSQNASFGTDVWQISCSICNRTITGNRFVCKLCACMDLCSSCVQRYPCHSRLHPNIQHELFEVSNVRDKNSQFTGLASERFKLFLSNLDHKCLEKNADQSEIELFDDSVFALAPRKIVLVPNTAFGLVTIISVILFGGLAILLGVWYSTTV